MVRLTLFLELPFSSGGGGSYDFRGEELRSFTSRTDRTSVSALLLRLRETFGSRVELRVLDPKCLFWIFSVMRYRIKATEPAWILRGRCVFRGIPSWEELHRLLEEEVTRENQK